ncbi:hypothetical protein J6590_006864 [Homalodisca vitripennis]|nr:hypothetical protein J6590_006864 [Homalodisca vitripennis]
MVIDFVTGWQVVNVRQSGNNSGGFQFTRDAAFGMPVYIGTADLKQHASNLGLTGHHLQYNTCQTTCMTISFNKGMDIGIQCFKNFNYDLEVVHKVPDLCTSSVSAVRRQVTLHTAFSRGSNPQLVRYKDLQAGWPLFLLSIPRNLLVELKYQHTAQVTQQEA